MLHFWVKIQLMEIILIVLVVALGLSTLFAINYRNKKRISPVSGGVYTIKSKSGKFQIIKVLAMSKKGFAHYLLYPAEMTLRPETLQISVMADRPHHTRIEISKFHKLQPAIIGRIQINAREIQRYLRPKAS